jgi:hypothetical protein
MIRTPSAVARIVVMAMVVSLVGLVARPAGSKCRGDCKRALATEFRACKTTCEKGKPGKPCRAACKSALRAARLACRGATNPTPPDCGGPITTTTTTPGGGATSTTVPGSPGTGVKGALTATPGRFNYNATLGLPGANATCNTNFPGSHVCTLTELQSAPASALAGLRDTASNAVTSFWAIDSSAPALQQCNDDAVGGSGLNWEYATAHTASRGQKVALNNGTGVLGSLQTGLQCNLSGNSWVACCQ